MSLCFDFVFQFIRPAAYERKDYKIIRLEKCLFAIKYYIKTVLFAIFLTVLPKLRTPCVFIYIHIYWPVCLYSIQRVVLWWDLCCWVEDMLVRAQWETPKRIRLGGWHEACCSGHSGLESLHSMDGHAMEKYLGVHKDTVWSHTLGRRVKRQKYWKARSKEWWTFAGDPEEV